MDNGFAEFAAIEKRGWNDRTIVEAYVDHFAPVTNAVAPRLAELAGGSGKSVLDLCCGQGDLTRLLCETGASVSGLDFSRAMLDAAEKAAPTARLYEGDAANMSFPDGCFDAVACNFGVMHLPDRQAALEEVRRVLRPGGNFIMSTWVGPTASPAFATVFGAIKAHADFSRAPDLFGIAEPDGAREMIERVGLSLQSHEVAEPAWLLEDPSDLFQIFLTATVGARMLIMSQAKDIVSAIRDDITSAVAVRFKNGSGYRVPVPVAIMMALRT
jgi:SAM-dependent methyltransferase